VIRHRSHLHLALELVQVRLHGERHDGIVRSSDVVEWLIQQRGQRELDLEVISAHQAHHHPGINHKSAAASLSTQPTQPANLCGKVGGDLTELSGYLVGNNKNNNNNIGRCSEKGLMKGGTTSVELLQKTALLGTAHILRRVLESSQHSTG